MNIKETYGSRIEKLWNECHKVEPEYMEIIKRGIAIPSEICSGGLLFIGVNPSYDKKLNDGYYRPDPKGFFKKQFEIGESLGLNWPEWSHLDLMYIRETKQKVIEKAKNDSFFLEFLQKQYAISKEIIHDAHPKLIVVCNAFAKTWIEGDENVKTEWSEEFGTHIIKSTPLEGTPIIFTGMLTGQRALDSGSYEMLKWHIKNVWNSL